MLYDSIQSGAADGLVAALVRRLLTPANSRHLDTAKGSAPNGLQGVIQPDYSHSIHALPVSGRTRVAK